MPGDSFRQKAQCLVLGMASVTAGFSVDILDLLRTTKQKAAIKK
jgi:hypothetical protein